MNVDRLFAIKRPLVYQKAVETHKAGLVVAVWWLVQRKERKRDFKQIKKRLVALIPDLPLWFDRHIETGMSEHGCHCFVPIQNVSISRYFSWYSVIFPEIPLYFLKSRYFSWYPVIFPRILLFPQNIFPVVLRVFGCGSRRSPALPFQPR